MAERDGEPQLATRLAAVGFALHLAGGHLSESPGPHGLRQAAATLAHHEPLRPVAIHLERMADGDLAVGAFAVQRVMDLERFATGLPDRELAGDTAAAALTVLFAASILRGALTRVGTVAATEAASALSALPVAWSLFGAERIAPVLLATRGDRTCALQDAGGALRAFGATVADSAWALESEVTASAACPDECQTIGDRTGCRADALVVAPAGSVDMNELERYVEGLKQAVDHAGSGSNPIGKVVAALVKELTNDLGEALKGLGEEIKKHAATNPAQGWLVKVRVSYTECTEKCCIPNILKNHKALQPGHRWVNVKPPDAFAAPPPAGAVDGWDPTGFVDNLQTDDSQKAVKAAVDGVCASGPI